jgi:uncharacterized protein
MNLTGSYLLPCSQARAWAALNDPAQLQAALKGCEKLEKTSDTEFLGTLSTRIGPVSARFTSKVTLKDMREPETCTMLFEGQGGVAGFARGSAVVTLAPEGDGTRLTYVADTQIGGKLAQMGARLVEGTAKSMADDFFSKLAAGLAAEAPAAGDAVAPAAAEVVPPSAPEGGSQAWIYIAAAVVVALSLAYFYVAG